MKRLYLIFGFIFILSFIFVSCYTQSIQRSSNFLQENPDDQYTSVFLEERQNQDLYREYGARYFPNNPYALQNMMIVNGGFPTEGYYTMAIYYWWPRLMPRFGWQAFHYSVTDYEWYESPSMLYGAASYYLLYKPYYYKATATDYRKNDPVILKRNVNLKNEYRPLRQYR